jgi:hypothetical protein
MILGGKKEMKAFLSDLHLSDGKERDNFQLILGFIWEGALLWRRRAIGFSKKIIAGGGKI